MLLNIYPTKIGFMVKLVAFDLWRTLAEKPFSTAERIRKEFCPNSNLRHRYFVKLYEEVTQTTRWGSREEMAEDLLRKLGSQASERNVARVIDIMEEAEANFSVYGHSIGMLNILKVHGYVTGLVSNTNVFSIEHVKEKSELLKHVDFPVFSFEVGRIKPEKAIFEELLKRSGCSAEDTVMVGDKEDDDIIPAKELGMNAILYRDYGQLKTEFEKFGIQI
jgi:HAD superfamily hydrolase (TIGR01549 family)